MTKNLSGRQGWLRWVLVLSLALIGLWAISADLQPNRRVSAEKASTTPLALMPQSSFLFRFDPSTQTFYSYTLIMGSIPLDVVVTGTVPVHVWFTEYGTNAIGHLVFTDTSQVTLTEYAITSTANAQPFRLALSGDDVWFTERGANQVGRLNNQTNQVDEFFGNGLSPNSSLAGISVAPDGSVWVAGQSSNRLARLVVTDTQHYSFFEYAHDGTTGLPFPSGPLGISVVPDLPGSYKVFFTAPVSNAVGFLTPSTGHIIKPGAMTDYPFDTVYNPSDNTSLFTEPNVDQIGRFQYGTNTIPGYFTVPHATRLSRVFGNSVWISQQDPIGQLANLTYTDTNHYTVTSYPLPISGLILTGVALADDTSVWMVGYLPYRIFLPEVLKN